MQTEMTIKDEFKEVAKELERLMQKQRNREEEEEEVEEKN